MTKLLFISLKIIKKYFLIHLQKKNTENVK